MVKNDRSARSRSFGPEALETRNLLSTILGSKPTLDALDGFGVQHNRFGGISITQPAVIQVFGTAQPGAPGSTVEVSIFAEDSNGTIVNGGAPLATVTPDVLGRYRATVTLPSRLRADVNYLVARETGSITEQFNLAINPTTLSGLNGTLTIDPGTLSGLAATVANPATTLTGVTGTVANPGSTSTGLTGTITNGPGTISGFGGTVTTPATPISNLAGTIATPVFPISTPGGAGTGGPAVSTLAGGTGTLGAQVGTITGGSGAIAGTTSNLTQTGSVAIAPSTSTLTQTGTGAIAGTTSTLTQTGTAVESNRTGNFAQTGTAAIAATTGTATRLAQEVATSDPLVVFIHQPRNVGLLFPGGVGGGVAVSRAHARGPAVVFHAHAQAHSQAAAVGYAQHVHAVRAARHR